MARKGVLFVVSAPSGTGKTTLCGMLLAEFRDVKFSVSCTTRPPRKGETEGREYHFVSRETFLEMVKRGEFLEWAEVYGNLYGTPKEPVMQALREGKDILLEIDTEGAMQVKRNFPDAVLIFIAPPSIKELERRLKSRGTDSEQAIRERLSKAVKEMESARHYDYILVNDKLRVAYEKLRAIVIAERCKASRVFDAIREITERRS